MAAEGEEKSKNPNMLHRSYPRKHFGVVGRVGDEGEHRKKDMIRI